MKILSFAIALSFAAVPAAFAQSSHSKGGHDGHMAQTQTSVAGTGSVDAVNAASRSLKLTHAPIKALGWPSMTMDFAVAEGVDISKLKVGDKVVFDLVRGADNIYMIKTLTKK